MKKLLFCLTTMMVCMFSADTDIITDNTIPMKGLLLNISFNMICSQPIVNLKDNGNNVKK